MYATSEPVRVSRPAFDTPHQTHNLRLQLYHPHNCLWPHAAQALLKPSPSLVHCNLCAVGPGVAYVHTRSAAVTGRLPQGSSDSIEAAKVRLLAEQGGTKHGSSVRALAHMAAGLHLASCEHVWSFGRHS